MLCWCHHEWCGRFYQRHQGDHNETGPWNQKSDISLIFFLYLCYILCRMKQRRPRHTSEDLRGLADQWSQSSFLDSTWTRLKKKHWKYHFKAKHIYMSAKKIENKFYPLYNIKKKKIATKYLPVKMCSLKPRIVGARTPWSSLNSSSRFLIFSASSR